MNRTSNSGSGSGDEQDLIVRMRNGERDLYRVLVERYSPMVFHLVRRYVREEAQVQELAQEVFVRAWERLDRYDGRSAFSTWLYALTRNRCLDYLKDIRRRQVRLGEMEPDASERLFSSDRTAHDDMEDKERWQQLKMAVNGLHEDSARPLLLKYRDGYTYDMISKITGVSVAALKVRVHRARKEIMKTMEANQAED